MEVIMYRMRLLSLTVGIFSGVFWANPAVAVFFPDKSVEFVLASPVYSKDRTYDHIYYTRLNLAKVEAAIARMHYKVKKLYDHEATAENYMNYLSCPRLKGF